MLSNIFCNYFLLRVQTHIWSKAANILANKIEWTSIRSIVSFTFDDAPHSSFINGGKILETYGFRGTFYVSAGLLGKKTGVGQIANMDTIKVFHRRGHEIGNHTYDHIDCIKENLIAILKNVRRNRASLKRIMTSNYAYPYGSMNAKSKVAVRLLTTSARGISFGINRDSIDLMDLKASKIYSRIGTESCMDLINECAERGGWIIFYTHDVSNEPSEYGCTPEQLENLVRTVKNRKLAIETVENALKIISEDVREKISLSGFFRVLSG